MALTSKVAPEGTGITSVRKRVEAGLLLAATAVLYLWNLGANGWANPYYSAAAFAGADNFTSLFFGASDPGNGISVDKPPLAVWVMSLSVKLFGLNPWSIQVPQALMGVATVWLVYRMAATVMGHRWGLVAGALMAFMPVSTAVFRYNNPDALLMLLMTGAAAITLDAIRRRRVSFLAVAGLLLGAGFLTKQLQVAFILPALIAAVVFASAWSWKTKAGGILWATAAAIVTAGSWLTVVALTPSAARPFIGGTRNNSFLELTFGYNGLDRLTGVDAQRTQIGEQIGAEEFPQAGPLRYLYPQLSAQVTWLLPLACAGLIVAIIVWRRTERQSHRAFLLLNGLWFGVSAGVVSMMSGIVHPYYTLAAVPAGACIAAFGLKTLLERRDRRSARFLLGLASALTLLVSYSNALRGADSFPWLPTATLAVGAVATTWAVLPPRVDLRRSGLVLTLCLVLTGPGLWSLATAAVPHAGAGLAGGPPIDGYRTDDPSDPLMHGRNRPDFAATMFGNEVVPQTVDILRQTPVSIRWPGAVVGSQSAARYELESQRAVLAVGGFDGTDPFPTLDQFKAMVGRGDVGYLIVGQLPPATSLGIGESAKIYQWVKDSFPCQKISGECVYRLQP